MLMNSRLKKAMLSAHLTVSVGWIGAVAGYIGLGFGATSSSEADTVRAMWIAMERLGWFVIVPLAVSSLLTGVVMAVGTKWGLFRHYWVMFSLVLTVSATGVLILHMPTVSSTAELAQTLEGSALKALGGDLFHSTIGLVVLLAIQVLNIYKPQGLTRYGWRKAQTAASIGQVAEGRVGSTVP